MYWQSYYAGYYADLTVWKICTFLQKATQNTGKNSLEWKMFRFRTLLLSIYCTKA